MDTLLICKDIYLKMKDIKSIVFLGSAGAYRHSKLKIGDIAYSNKFVYERHCRNRKQVPTYQQTSIN